MMSFLDLPLIRAWMTKDRRKTRRDLAIVKKSNHSSPIPQTSSTRKVLKKIAKRFAAMAVYMGRDAEEALWSWISYASYGVNKLPSITAFLAVHKGKIILETFPVHHLEGSNLRRESYLNSDSARLRQAYQEPESEDAAADDGNHSPNLNHKAILLNSISRIRRELPEPSLGWPLLPRKSSPNQEFNKQLEARDISVVEWVMSLPNRVLHSNQISADSETNTNVSTINGCKTEEASQSSEAESVINDSRISKDGNYGLECNAANSKPGWPLLRITASTTSESFSEYEAINMAMVERERNAPIQSTIELPPTETVLVSTEEESPFQTEIFLPALRKIPNDLGLCCSQFSLKELKQATSGFSPENLIGEGGCSNVYQGCLPGGKQVAVKILKPYREAWTDFSLEVDIVSSCKHKHITPLIGVCVEDHHLICVHDFFPRGSLEEILHGQNKKFVLPWGARFKVATAIAEALNYLHNECSPSIIHRDVKSSNILLSDDFQPQLTDFGLAIRGPVHSAYMIETNVVGTFGYIAPEYIMEGRVSDKIDVYSFGVVLLELVTGRRPISSKALEGQESFIQWARTLLERKNLQGLLDPALDGDFDVAQMSRMAFAASLCLNRLDGCRPKVSQILETLRGEKEPTDWHNFHATDMTVPNDRENDDPSLEFVHKPYTYLSASFKDDDSTSICSIYTTSSRRRAGKEHRLKLKDYLKKEQD
ncbi:hypothetical protein DITRI_Ditri10aG0012000 [Diplodiscus trichospermus]